MGSVLSRSAGGSTTYNWPAKQGEEEVKGNDVIKATAELLADSDLNYYDL